MAPSEPTLRPAAPRHVEAMAGLLGELFSIEGDFSPDVDRQRRGLAMLLADGRSRVLVAEAGGETVAMVTGQLVLSTAEGAPSVLVEDLVVAGPWRRRGLARRLLEAVASWGAKRGATRLQLLADRDNPGALACYRSLGWQTTRLICLRQETR